MSEYFDVPNGFRQVSYDEFHGSVGKLDVIPHPEKMCSRWEMRNRQIVGYTTPGYMCQGRKAYYIKEPRP